VQRIKKKKLVAAVPVFVVPISIVCNGTLDRPAFSAIRLNKNFDGSVLFF
jgi:hypothetical protein